jgi:hypothetical protein
MHGAIYEENPTVTCTPVEGQKYLRQLKGWWFTSALQTSPPGSLFTS